MPGAKVLAAIVLSAIFLFVTLHESVADSLVFSDHFDGPSLSQEHWYIPTYDHSGDGTYVGRTQFRVTQNSSLPEISGGNVCIPVQTYSPRGLSFYGTEIITRQQFTPREGLDVIVHARMANSNYHGIVGGIFLYALKGGSNTLHDEIDFEFLTNVPDHFQTNIYGDEPLGVGHAQLTPYRSGTITNYHTYEIRWQPTRVSWLVDGELVRVTTSNIPTGPMNFYINAWVPDSAWLQAYSESIQPTNVKGSNVALDSLCVDSVMMRPLLP